MSRRQASSISAQFAARANSSPRQVGTPPLVSCVIPPHAEGRVVRPAAAWGARQEGLGCQAYTLGDSSQSSMRYESSSESSRRERVSSRAGASFLRLLRIPTREYTETRVVSSVAERMLSGTAGPGSLAYAQEGVRVPAKRVLAGVATLLAKRLCCGASALAFIGGKR